MVFNYSIIIIKINEEFREKTLLTCIMTVPEIGKNNNNNDNNNGDILRRLDENKIPNMSFQNLQPEACI
jgi:hypothetical protein